MRRGEGGNGNHLTPLFVSHVLNGHFQEGEQPQHPRNWGMKNDPKTMVAKLITY